MGAAEVALAIERLADGGVATAGRLEISPGAQNVVPGEAELWGRGAEHRRGLVGELWAWHRRGYRRHRRPASADRVAQLDLSQAARPGVDDGWRAPFPKPPRHLGSSPLPSRAVLGTTHSHMAGLGPMGMIFVPSRAGRSHCPEEWTDLEQVGTGISVLAETVIICDHREEAAPGEAVQRAT